MRDAVALEFRRQAARLEAAERRLAMMHLSGKVAQKDADKRRLRLKLGTNSKGEDVLSPWIRWQEAGVGALSIHSEPAEGEQMTMVSMSGTIGTGSIAVPASFDQDHQAPSKSSDMTVFARGKARIEMTDDGFVFKGHARFRDGVLTHDDVDVGKTHRHDETMPGGGLSGKPQS